MNWQTVMFVGLFLVIALSSIFMAGRAWQRDRSPGSLTFTILMLVVAVWIVVVAANHEAVDPTIKLFFAKIAHASIAWSGLLWLTFGYEFSRPESRLMERKGAWLWALPLLSIVVIFTNELHGLMWKLPQASYLSGNGALVLTRGPFFWVHSAYNYIYIVAGFYFLVRGLLASHIFHRRQIAVLLLFATIPLLASTSYLLGWISQTTIDPTPFAITITGMVYSWTLWYFKLFDPAPLVREVILEHIGDGFIALDRQNRIIDANILARKFLRLEYTRVKGLPAEVVLSGWPELMPFIQAGQFTKMEISAQKRRRQTLEVRLSPWYNRNGLLAGRLVILDDITLRKQIEVQLRQSEHRYRLLFNASPVGMIVINENAVISFASPEMHALYSGDPNLSLEGLRFTDLIHPDDHAVAIARLARMVKTGEKLDPQEYRMILPDGTIKWIEAHSSQLDDDGSGIRGVLTAVRDVTWRKDMETRLQINLDQQTFLNDLLRLLHHPPDLNDALAQVLERTGKFIQFDRVCLCAAGADSSEVWIEIEWSREGVAPHSAESPLFRYSEVPSWTRLMQTEGMVLAGWQSEKCPTPPEDITDFLESWNIESLAALPVFGIDERLYGYLGFERSRAIGCLTAEQLALLQNVGKLVSSAIAMRQAAEAEQRQKALREVLHETASMMTGTLNFEEVLDRILANLERMTKHEAASIALIDGDGLVQPVRWLGFDEEGMKWMLNKPVALSERKTYQHMANTGEPLIIPDVRDSSMWTLYKERMWVRSYAAAPILIKGEVVGFINLDSLTPNFFTADLAPHLQVFADQAAVAIQNSRLYNAAHRRADEMSILYNIGLTLTEGLEQNKVLARLFEQCKEVLPVDVAYVAMYDEETGIINHSLFYTHGGTYEIPARNIHEKKGLTGTVILEGQTLYLPDLSLPETQQKYDIIFLDDDSPTRSYLGAPMFQRDRVIGVLSIQSYRAHAFTIEQVRLLETIANQASIALQNARMYEKMRQMAITDEVTLLFTRRHFISLGITEIKRALRYKHPLSVLMIDIDYFKTVNDTYGHAAGDVVIRGVAQICRSCLRAVDIIGRWGGEEFCVVLPETDYAGAMQTAERICRLVAETKLQVEPGTWINRTVSIGVAELPPSSRRLEDLVNQADVALYRAKKAGGNQAVMY